jgi:hypothetical protein
MIDTKVLYAYFAGLSCLGYAHNHSVFCDYASLLRLVKCFPCVFVPVLVNLQVLGFDVLTYIYLCFTIFLPRALGCRVALTWVNANANNWVQLLGLLFNVLIVHLERFRVHIFIVAQTSLLDFRWWVGRVFSLPRGSSESKLWGLWSLSNLLLLVDGRSNLQGLLRKRSKMWGPSWKQKSRINICLSITTYSYTMVLWWWVDREALQRNSGSLSFCLLPYFDLNCAELWFSEPRWWWWRFVHW